MSIRIASYEDLPQIIALYAELETDPKEIIDLDTARSIYNKMKTYPDYNLYVIEINGKIAGSFELAIMDNLAHKGSKSGLIEDVVVAAKYQGQGLGKKMMQSALKICKEKSCYKVSLSSNLKRKAAHKFYEGLGYKIHGYSFLTELE